MIFKNGELGYYVGVYDHYLAERDGIFLEDVKGLEGFYKTELLKSKYATKAEYNFDSKHVLPIALKEDSDKVEFRIDNKTFNLSNNLKNRFYYYPIEKGNVKIKSKNAVVLGDPIKVEKDSNKPSLVLNIFVDGLSQSVIEEYGLENLMPYTYNYFSEGTICDNVYVNGEWTYVNMASFFTGDYIVNHGMFHPNYNTTLKKDKKILSEVLKKDGYFTSKIDGDWRSQPTYGYIRGIDRFVYQASIRGMDIEESISEAIEHIEAFRDLNKFLWITVNELHDIADGFEGRLITQMNNTIDSRLNKSNKSNKTKKDSTSVRQNFNKDKKNQYLTQLKRVDNYLGVLFSYLEESYNNEDILVSLISDHGQGYLLKKEEPFLSEKRIKVPFLFRGKNINKGVCSELIEGVDLISILLKSLNIVDIDKDKRDSNLPVYFGGMKERKNTYTESIFPGSTYKATITDKEHEFIFETEGLVADDGRFELGDYNYKLVNKKTKEEDTKKYRSKVESYLKRIFKHICNNIIS